MAEASYSGLIFQGKKFLWRTRNLIEVAIVSHAELATTEVIVYDAALAVEAERIYINTLVLQSKLNQTEIKAKFIFAKHCHAPRMQFEAEIVARAVSDYILNRLFIKEYSREGNFFKALLETCDKDLICSKPKELSPYIIRRDDLYP